MRKVSEYQRRASRCRGDHGRNVKLGSETTTARYGGTVDDLAEDRLAQLRESAVEGEQRRLQPGNDGAKPAE